MGGAGLRTETSEQEALEARLRDRRFWAVVFDLWLLPLLMGTPASYLGGGQFTSEALLYAVLLVVLVATEARTGRTPGKKLFGLRVERTDGSPVGWGGAVRRRLWMLPAPAGLIPGVPDEAAGGVLSIAVLSILVSMYRSADARGWHERLSSTRIAAAGSWTDRQVHLDARRDRPVRLEKP